MRKILVLDNMRSAHNVGSLFRTADAAGVERILLCGYTPAPIDRFGRVQKEIEKTSLDASKSVPYEELHEEASVFMRIEVLKRDGFTIAAIEQAPNAHEVSTFDVPDKVAYILGNEIDGVSPALLARVDVTLQIPMLGKKESLNVSVAGGIVLFLDIVRG